MLEIMLHLHNIWKVKVCVKISGFCLFILTFSQTEAIKIQSCSFLTVHWQIGTFWNSNRFTERKKKNSSAAQIGDVWVKNLQQQQQKKRNSTYTVYFQKGYNIHKV